VHKWVADFPAVFAEPISVACQITMASINLSGTGLTNGLAYSLHHLLFGNMIAHLTGQLVHKSPTYTVIDVGGLGYDVKISLNTFSAIKALETCQLFTHQYIKGDVHTLYGFASIEEKNWFLHLINVNSVGPRTAMTILSSLSPPELEQTIINNQLGVLKGIKGIGDKAAQRIILELKDKLGSGPAISDNILAMQRPDPIGQEALAALMKLGIGKLMAEKAIAKVRSTYPDAVSLEALIKQALQVT
jgi:holliday junction DNA helicase RuvA